MKATRQIFRNPIFWAFFISFSYWAYLGFASRMIIDCDAISYESTGRMLAEKGWQEYFRSGPNREPLYLLLISLSVKLGKLFSLSYQTIQVFFQFCILFLTQVLMLQILLRLNINNLICGFTILYLGISPAIVNSALSLFSEIAAYPIILGIILLTFKSWSSFRKGRKQTLYLAVMSGLIFTCMVLTKAIFEFIIPVFVVILFLSNLFTRNRKIVVNGARYLVLSLSFFCVLVTSYKLANKVFNGNFVIANRGEVMFYGSAARRLEPLTKEGILTALAYIPGEGVCQGIFGEEKCSFWSFKKSDELGYAKIYQLEDSGLPPKEVNRQVVKMALAKIIQNPFQYSLLWFMEGLKLLFWESTQMGFVSYPAIFVKLFQWPVFKNGLRLLMSILTLAALLFSLGFLLRRKEGIFLPLDEIRIVIFLILLLLFLFGGFSALCVILPRYTLPMAPLYLILSAFAIEKLFPYRN
jgi:hypothetical protein